MKIADQEFIQLSEALKSFVSYPEKDKMGFSNVYMINLLRRAERRRRMMSCINELGLNVEVVDAVDGRCV